MANDAVSYLVSYVGWAFLPSYATSLLQTFYYRLTLRAGTPHPHPSSPVYALHRRRIHILVITVYLFYTLYEALYQIRLAGDFYNDLGVSHLADERVIKSRFRRLAALHHPDKAPSGALSVSPSSEVEAYFVHLKLAQDTLLDPAKRFAYDRFGPAMVRWQNLKTIQDYCYAGLQSLVPQYVGGAISLVLFNMFWWPEWGRYWRYFSFAALLTLELLFITHHHPILDLCSRWPLPDFLSHLPFPNHLPHYLLPFQILTFLRRFSLSLNIFISQLTPPSAAKGAASAQQTQQLAHVTNLARATDAEASRLLGLGLAPFKGDRESVETLRHGMREGLLLGAVRGAKEVREAVGRVMERRRRQGVTVGETG